MSLSLKITSPGIVNSGLSPRLDSIATSFWPIGEWRQLGVLQDVVYERNATDIFSPLFVFSFPSNSAGVRCGSTSNEI